MDLREKVRAAISLWALNGSEFPAELADDILDIPEIRDALQEMERLDDRLADAREDGWKACEDARDWPNA